MKTRTFLRILDVIFWLWVAFMVGTAVLIIAVAI